MSGVYLPTVSAVSLSDMSASSVTTGEIGGRTSFHASSSNEDLSGYDFKMKAKEQREKKKNEGKNSSSSSNSNDESKEINESSESSSIEESSKEEEVGRVRGERKSQIIENPTPHKLPDGANAAPLETNGATATDKLIIVMVGLPATGKTHIARRITRFLDFFHDIPSQIFNVGEYRR
jgi:hypothetical protein